MKSSINMIQTAIMLLILILIFARICHSQDMLSNYLKEAAKNNPELKSLFSRYMADLEKVPQAGALPDPQIAFGYFVSPVETRVGAQRAKLSASQMFPWFGTLNAQQKVASQMAKASLEVFEDAKHRLFFNVKSTYYNLYVLDQAIRITRKTLDLLSSFKALATIKFESGKAGMVDVLRVEMELEELENQLAYLEDSELPLLTEFEFFLNTKPELLFPDTLWVDSVGMDKKMIYDSIIAQNPELQKLEHESLLWDNK
ncbi:MAG: TolC family protein, partial [Bacteroidetes bacterium]|nr:TolC family protein [Bacteroidota bacterium]